MDNSPVIPALIRKFHEVMRANTKEVVVWGTGTPKREFLYSEDMSDACVYLMNLQNNSFDGLLGSDESVSGKFEPPLVNIGVGEDISICDLATLVKQVVGYTGEIIFDTLKPDGTPRKLMDVSRLNKLGRSTLTPLPAGLTRAYTDFLSNYAAD